MSNRELLHAIAEYFDRERIDHALIGAFALFGYGYRRATDDIDFLVHKNHMGKAIRFVESLGFETLHASEAFSNHAHPVGETRVDFMYVGEETARQVFASSRKILLLGNLSMTVVSPEHLIALKLFAAQNNPDRRLKELSDIKEILMRCEVDRSTIRHYVRQYGLEQYREEILGTDEHGQ